MLFPPLRACLRWAATFVFWLSATIICMTIVSRRLRSQALPEFWFTQPMRLPIFLVGMTVAFGALIFVITWACAPTITIEGLRGVSISGRKAVLPWTSLDTVESTSVQGLPALVVKSSSLKKKVLMFTLGIDRRAFHGALARTAGSNHVLTKCFEPHDA